MKDSFSALHPLVCFLYFAAVILFSMFNMQPVCLAVSLYCALINALLLGGRRSALFSLRFLLPAAVMIMLVNPLFNHQGATILAYFPWGNPFTLESAVYGLASAALLCSVALWFSCWNRVMTSDKIIFLFGRVSPSLSLVLSMALRFVPRFFAQLRQIRQARAQLFGNKKRTLRQRFRDGLRVLSVMVSLAMEGSIETADSMKARGYGLKGRTSFSLYRFTGRDALILSAVVTASGALTAMLISGRLRFRYFPTVKGELFSPEACVFYVLYLLLMLTPLLLNVWEGIKWKQSRSKI